MLGLKRNLLRSDVIFVISDIMLSSGELPLIVQVEPKSDNGLLYAASKLRAVVGANGDCRSKSFNVVCEGTTKSSHPGEEVLMEI